MKKKKIYLDLHQQDNTLILDSQDVFEYISEQTEEEIKLAHYIDQWCLYLNYYLFHNKELLFGDADYARLEGWLSGYNYAHSIGTKHYDDCVEIYMKKYTIVLRKPFDF